MDEGGASRPASKNILCCVIKIRLYRNKSRPYIHAIPPDGGALANVNNAGWAAVDAEGAFDEGPKAYGEGVWSRHRDADVKSAGQEPLMMVAKKPVHQGEHVISRKAIACGDAG
jgi:hypothetical protein